MGVDDIDGPLHHSFVPGTIGPGGAKSGPIMFAELVADIGEQRLVLIRPDDRSTVCGLLPFLLKGQNEVFWFSMAVGTIGGLAASLLAVLTILPVLLWKRRLPANTG
jgi:hypothetical protein